MQINIEDLKYPIGKLSIPEKITLENRKSYIEIIDSFPQRLRKEVVILNKEQLDTPYRPDGWTVRQVINHCADSHMNAFIRLKLALSEENPTIKPYPEKEWAELADSKSMPIEPALTILDGVHKRWLTLLNLLTEENWKRTFYHPGSERTFSLEESLCLYAWHSEHHLTHITQLKKSKAW